MEFYSDKLLEKKYNKIQQQRDDLKSEGVDSCDQPSNFA